MGSLVIMTVKRVAMISAVVAAVRMSGRGTHEDGERKMAEKIVIESDAPVEYEVEDGGAALIAHIENEEADPHFFVRLHSWNDAGDDHPTARKFEGKRVRVTVEVIDVN